ncbi:hypothetical protein PCC8801_0168 [Rippkaea orientalis PCC 8801]|uniref:Uncharacterized protein n=2 Tax=Rippkaea TaxID=2546365 RepID=B7K1W5_RIPO1|nr:hypothetical protein PCC8801_0168 [Rippkaea orientalis PCC 8801]
MIIEELFEILKMNNQEIHPQPLKTSAEERAIERLKDEDDPNQWITVIEAEEEIDQEVLDKWLVQRGYKISLQS